MSQIIVVLVFSVALGVAIAYGDRYLLQSPEPVVQTLPEHSAPSSRATS